MKGGLVANVPENPGTTRAALGSVLPCASFTACFPVCGNLCNLRLRERGCCSGLRRCIHLHLV